MPVAGAVVTPVSRELESDVIRKLRAYKEVEIKGTGDRGIALVLEAAEVRRLKDISEEISGWEEVIEFDLAYLNWEDEEKDSRKYKQRREV